MRKFDEIWNVGNVRRMYESGLTDAAIAKVVGVTDVTVSNFRKKHGIKTRTQMEHLTLGKVQNRCDGCKEKVALKAQSKSLESRTKTCAYRHCGRTFVDNSEYTGMSYCHDEHRRREKLFRSGQAVDLSYFRNPDPILEPKDP